MKNTQAVNIRCLAMVLCLLAESGAAAPQGDAVYQELEALKKRVDELESRQLTGGGEIEAKESASETSAAENDDESFDVGGALRFNYALKNFDDNQQSRRGDMGLDIFRLNLDGRKGNIILSTEYRFYSYMNAIHHGWLGYDFDDGGQLQLGISQVPFGLLPYDSHNFWFGVPYYIGLGDDYDAGVKYVFDGQPWNIQLAFYKNAELGNASDLERYSYDLVTTGSTPNEETNTVNGRIAYLFGEASECQHELGLSLQWGQVYNRDTDKNGDQWASAVHLDSRCGRWNFQFEGGRYVYSPQNPLGVSDETVTFGAFGGSHEVAAKANFGVANIAYNLPVAGLGVDILTCYNDFSVLSKDAGGFANSYLNTTGCAIGVGPTFTYIDIVRGRNMLFFSDGSLAGGGSNDWDTRLNINLGYYW